MFARVQRRNYLPGVGVVTGGHQHAIHFGIGEDILVVRRRLRDPELLCRGGAAQAARAGDVFDVGVQLLQGRRDHGLREVAGTDDPQHPLRRAGLALAHPHAGVGRLHRTAVLQDGSNGPVGTHVAVYLAVVVQFYFFRDEALHVELARG